MKKKMEILIYPYNRGIKPFIVYQELFEDIEIKRIVSPRGWGLADDVIDSFGEKYTVKTNFEEEITNCDCVWFCEDGKCKLPEKILREKISEVLKLGKGIIYTRKERFADIDLSPYVINEKRFKTRVDLMFMNELLAIDVPIITVLGNSKEVDQMEIQLALRYEFMKRKYKVTSVSPMQSGLLMNVHPIPEFIMNEAPNLNDKIAFFNHYLKVLVNEEKPDIIVLGIPGGIYPYGDSDYKELGKGTYEILRAVESDFVIMCSVYGEWIQEELEREKETLSNRYQLDIDVVHMAPYYWNKKENLGGVSKGQIIELDEDFLYKQLPKLDEFDLWNLRKYENVQKITDKIIEELS